MAKLDFSWQYAAEADHPHVFFRLYENGQKVVDDIGEMKFSLLMDDHAHATYSYAVTTVDADSRLESTPSNAIKIPFFPPAAPTGLQGSLTQ